MKRHSDKKQYCLNFEADENTEVDRSIYQPNKREASLENDLPEYDLFCKIKIKDLYDSSLIDETSLNLLAKNKKIYLIDFLRMSNNNILQLKGTGKVRFKKLLQLRL